MKRRQRAMLRILACSVILSPVGTASAANNVHFNELLQLPGTLSYPAHKQGQGKLRHRQMFTDEVSASRGVNLYLSSRSTADFSLKRLSLGFDDEQQLKLVDQHARISAIAKLNSTGSGMLNAIWEVADPTSTAGEVVFRPIGIVQQFLVKAATIELTSPPLPTAIAGHYLLRLKVKQPAITFELPVIRYVVRITGEREVPDATK